ncbi:MAG: hypothetical protein ACT4QA_04435 [Panacagrimonas sp.]
MEIPEPHCATLQISLAQLAALFDLIYPAPADDAGCPGASPGRQRPGAGPRYARQRVARAISAADNFLALNPDADASTYDQVAARVFEGPRSAEDVS